MITVRLKLSAKPVEVLRRPVVGHQTGEESAEWTPSCAPRHD